MRSGGGKGGLWAGLVLLGMGFVVAIALCEVVSQRILSRAANAAAAPRPLRRLLENYLAARAQVLEHKYQWGAIVLLVPPAGYLLLRTGARRLSRWREERVGMAFHGRDDSLANPFDGAPGGPLEAVKRAFTDALRSNPDPTRQAVLGFDRVGQPVYLTDHARSMHVHLIGQTGSGKTQAVIHPLLFQDAWRPHVARSGHAHKRSILFVDGKGAIENEDLLAQIGAATQRAGDVRIFTLNPGVPTHTYNPLYLGPRADPRQVAERVFSTFATEMDEPYYRDMARELFLNLVCALASTGKQMCLLDVMACVGNDVVLEHALTLASDKAAVRRIEGRLRRAGHRFDETYSGLLAALGRYDHPAVNAYQPDIVLEEDLEAGRIIGFSLPANAYKFLARAIGIIVLQHVQHVGAMRQMARGRDRAPIAVFADEFYTFAYDGFVDAVNKLRDANISLLLSHQSLSDLERVSPEYARAIWDNTRNKIVLYSNDSELCEQLSAAVGTEMGTELTVRRSADGFLNQVSTLEASSREVDKFKANPNLPKNLRVGQAYLFQAGIAESHVLPIQPSRVQRRERQAAVRVVGVNLPMLPDLPSADRPLPHAEEPHGLGLYRAFVAGV